MFLTQLHDFVLPSAMHEDPNFFTSSPRLVIFCLFSNKSPRRECEVAFHCDFALHLLMMSDVEQLFRCLLAI